MTHLLRTAADIVEAYRRRVAELGLTHATVDAISGLPDGYTSKLLAPTPMKTMSRKAIELLNGALGMGFVVAIDEAQVKRVEKRWVKRKRPYYGVPSMVLSIDNEVPREIQISPELSKHLASPSVMRERGRLGNIARNKRLSPWKRRVLARRAANARWSKADGLDHSS